MSHKFCEIVKEATREYFAVYKKPYAWFIASIIFIILCVLQYSEVFGQTPQTLYIAIDSTANSQMLKRELECTNWQARINPAVLKSLNPAQRSSFNEFALRMDKSQKRISELWTVVYINYHDAGSPTGTYPKYRIGKYREWNEFNSQAFSEVSYPLRTVEHLYEQWYYMDLVDKRLREYTDETDAFLHDKANVYHKWLAKSKNAMAKLFMDKEFYAPYMQELKDKKLTPEYFPRVPIFEEPLKLPYE